MTATAAANRCHQRPAAAHNSRAIRANWGYVRPENGRSALDVIRVTSCIRDLPSWIRCPDLFLAVRAGRRRAHGAAVRPDRRGSQLRLPGSARPETIRPAPATRQRMTAEAAKAPHQTAAGLSYASGPASSADLAAGQLEQVKVPGERTRESALDTSPPANRTAAVSPMEGRGGAQRTTAHTPDRGRQRHRQVRAKRPRSGGTEARRAIRVR